MTSKTSLAVALAAAAAFSLVATAPARAEWAIDLFGGVSWTKSTDVDVTGRDNNGLSTQVTISDVEVDPGFTAGARVGYWLESLPFLGLGVDAFFFSLPVPAQTVAANGTFSASVDGKPITFTPSGDANLPELTLPGVAFSPQLMLRLPLFVSDDAPKGRLQPYLGGGPAWAFTIESDELALILGGLFRAGVALQVFRFLALFAEYRYTFFPGFEVKDEGLTFKTDLNSHHVVAGLSFRF